MVTPESIVLRTTGKLNHDEAARLAKLAAASKARTVIIDMTRVTEATTPGLARLILVRRDLLQNKRDVCIAGIQGQPANLLEVHRLQDVLPLIHNLPCDALIDRPGRREPIDPAVPKIEASLCLTGFEQICFT